MRIHPVLGFTAVLCIAHGRGRRGRAQPVVGSRSRRGDEAHREAPASGGPDATASDARDFGIALSVASVLLMGLAVDWLAAAILAVSIVYYAVIYTIWLKPRTPQNIVIGGGAGAFPPLIGWVAVTGEITLMPVLLFAIIFVWTPPHFWALALFVKTDYAKVGIPMMPVVAGETATRRQILLYRVAAAAVGLLPWLIGGTGWIYGVAALVLSGAVPALALPVGLRACASEGDAMKPEKRLFGYSVLYLFALFAALVADRLVLGQWSAGMTPEEEEEFKRRRKRRNIVLGLVLLGFVVLFYAITIVRMG